MKSSQKILIAGLILMVLLNIGTLGFILFKSNHHRDHHMRGGRGHGGPGKFIGKRLNFTPEQEAALSKLRTDHDLKMDQLREKTESLRKQRFELIKSEPYDSVKTNQLAFEIGNAHAEIEKEMARHFVAIKALCTKDQLADFNQFIDRLSDHMPGGHRGGFGKDKHEGPGF